MSLETRGMNYGHVLGHWQIQKRLDHGLGNTAVFQMVHMDSPSVRSALKVISLIECNRDPKTMSEYHLQEYRKAKDSAKAAAEQEVMMMNGLQGLSNVVAYQDHTFVEWSDTEGFGCDMLIRMELLADLRGIIHRKKFFPEQEILKIGRHLCGALVLCHKNQIVHRDIKPENIFVNKEGFYKLGDFGISRILSHTSASSASTSVGTPQYWAPEQITGHYDHRVDIYSLGLVLYELANNCLLPFCSSTYVTAEEVNMRMTCDKLPPLTDVSPALAAVILTACAQDPDKRYQTAEKFLEALNLVTAQLRAAPPIRQEWKETVIADQGPEPTIDPWEETPPMQQEKSGKGLLIGLVLMLLLLAGAAAALIYIAMNLS